MLIPISNYRTDYISHAAVSGDGRRFVACNKVGKCSLFDDYLRQLGQIDLGSGVEWISLDHTGSQLLIGFWDRIDCYKTYEDIARLSSLPVVGTSVHCCWLKEDERALCVASWEREPLLSAWDLTSGTLIAQADLPARGGAGYMLIGHPEGEAMAAVAYSGQSEAWMFWAHFAHGRLRVFTQPEMEGVEFPCFHPSGRELVSSSPSGVRRIVFPSGLLAASMAPDEAFPQGPDDLFSYNIHFSRDDRFLAWQENLALYEFDLDSLRPLRTVLSGADGKVFGKNRFFSGQSWQMANGRLLTSDSQYDQASSAQTQTLRLWDASAIFEPVSSPDPTRPYTRKLLSTAD